MFSETVRDDEKTEAEKDETMRSLEELLHQDAQGFLKEQDDPRQRAARFDRIIERLEREGLDGPEDPEDDLEPT